MKKLLFVFFLFFGAKSAYSQGDYKTLQQCNNDTMEYVRYNLQENKSRYIGKSMKFFLKEVEVSWLMNTFGAHSTGGWVGSVENRKKIKGMWFCYLTLTQMTQYDMKDLVYFMVDIYFKVPPYTHSKDEFDVLYSDRKHISWDMDYYKFFKDYEIDDIKVIKFPMK